MKILSSRAMSTYEILEVISNDLDVNENTIYPILRRLTNDGFLVIEKKNVGVGAPRKYFNITDLGKKKFVELEESWNMFIASVLKIMEGKYE
ncbi:PadR family transcriptional regulator [Mycoplasmatota bacterium zrk1]